jgi:hypothetical protein
MPATISRGSVSPAAEEHQVMAAMRVEGLAPYLERRVDAHPERCVGQASALRRLLG